MDIGHQLYALCERLFPICRSITGDGVRETLGILREIVPDMTIHEVPTGTQVFDWTVPKECSRCVDQEQSGRENP